jgi:hypothetical protein
MAITIGDMLGGIGAAFGGTAQQYAQGIRQREQQMTQRKREELQARQIAMYQDAGAAYQLLQQQDLDGIINLANDRLEILQTFDDADPSDTMRILENAMAAKAGDPIALRDLATELTGAASAGRAMGILQAPEADTRVLKPGEQVFTDGEFQYGVPAEAKETFDILTPEQVQLEGLDPTKQYERNALTNETRVLGAGGVSVSVGAEPRSFPGLEKLLDENFAAASNSAAARPQLNILSQLAPMTTEGQFQATLSRMLPTYNDANTAFIGISNQVLPSLRVPGSGAQSDRDIDVLLNSIGQLSASAETKQLLIQAMIQKDQIMQQKADITQRYYEGNITAAEAAREIRTIDSMSIISPALQQALERVIPNAVPSAVFNNQQEVDAANLPSGTQFEMIDPSDPNKVLQMRVR